MLSGLCYFLLQPWILSVLSFVPHLTASGEGKEGRSGSFFLYCQFQWVTPCATSQPDPFFPADGVANRPISQYRSDCILPGLGTELHCSWYPGAKVWLMASIFSAGPWGSKGIEGQEVQSDFWLWDIVKVIILALFLIWGIIFIFLALIFLSYIKGRYKYVVKQPCKSPVITKQHLRWMKKVGGNTSSCI